MRAAILVLFAAIPAVLTQAQEQKVRLTGRVIDDASGKGIDGVLVRVWKGDKELGAEATLPDGKYTVPGLPLGSTVTVHYDGTTYTPKPRKVTIALNKSDIERNVRLLLDTQDTSYWRQALQNLEGPVDAERAELYLLAWGKMPESVIAQSANGTALRSKLVAAFINGTWTATVDDPNGGTQFIRYALAVNGGKLSGRQYAGFEENGSFTGMLGHDSIIWAQKKKLGGQDKTVLYNGMITGDQTLKVFVQVDDIKREFDLKRADYTLPLETPPVKAAK